VVRSNYLYPESARLYDFSLRLYEGLSRELNFNIMLSQRSHLMLAHSRHDLESLSRWGQHHGYARHRCGARLARAGGRARPRRSICPPTRAFRCWAPCATPWRYGAA